MGQYRCLFLNGAGSVEGHEVVNSRDEMEAVMLAKDMWRHRPHYFGMEVWRGGRCVHAARRPVHAEIRLPAAPVFALSDNAAGAKR